MTADPNSRVRIESAGTDPDEAVAMFRELYHGTHWESRPVPGRAASYGHRAIGDGTMTLRTSHFHGGTLDGEIVPVGEEYIVNWITTGHGTLEVDGTEIAVAPGTPVLFPANRSFRFAYSDFDQKLVHLDRALLEQVAGEQSGTPVASLDIDPATTPTRAAIRTWGQSIELVSRTLVGAPASPLLRAEMARLAAVAFLELYPNRPGPASTNSSVPRSSRMRSAVEYVHANAHLPITSTTIARAANLSVRAIQEGFQREFGLAPTVFVRHVRLDRVHAELFRADPTETSVQDVARRWGFAHLGRFSAAYAERFGEYPRETLRR